MSQKRPDLSDQHPAGEVDGVGVPQGLQLGLEGGLSGGGHLPAGGAGRGGGLLDVADPGVGGLDVVAQVDVDDGLPGARLARDFLQPRGVLEPSLEFVRDLLLHVLCCRAGPCGGDDHLADDEGGILHASEGLVGNDAANGKDDDEVPDDGAVAQRELGEVSHFVRTFSPSWRRWTPAVTTTAFCGSPVTTASRSRNAVTVTGQRCTTPSSTM